MVIHYSQIYKDDIKKTYIKLGYDSAHFGLYYRMMKGIDNPMNAKCDLPREEILQKFLRILEYCKTDFDQKKIDKTEIFMVGHREKQFEKYSDKKYLKKINLNNLDAGKFSSNQWAESRIYFTNDKILSDSSEFVGTVSTSWIDKYELLKIDNFENWKYARALYNSKEEDNIVLCADTYCSCEWIKTKKQGILLAFFEGYDILQKAQDFLEELGLSLNRHIKVPHCHQFIAHRKVYEDYTSFLKNNHIPDKVLDFVDKIRKQIKTQNYRNKYYDSIRSHAYIMEMISMYYFAKQEYFYVPCADQKEDWYSGINIQKRVNEWRTTT